MVTIATPEEALVLARHLHKDQRDKLGEDYVSGHLTRVVGHLAKYDDPVLSIAGALHDTLEHTGATRALLWVQGVPPEAIDAVDIVSKRPHEGGELGYRLFIDRVMNSGNGMAVRVKAADLADHLRRVPYRQVHLVEQLRPRYRDAWAVVITHPALAPALREPR
jgi:hypothetical protein